MADANHAKPAAMVNPLFERADADIILRLSDNVDFKVFKMLLALASPFFDDMFLFPQAKASNSDHAIELKGTLPVVHVSESASVLGMLLVMCYPTAAVDPPALDKLEDIDLLLEAAIKYDHARVEKRLREALVAPEQLRDHAVRVFAVDCRHKLEEEARVSARATLTKPIADAPFAAELDMRSGTGLLRLIKYHKTCMKNAKEALANFPWPEFSSTAISSCPIFPRNPNLVTSGKPSPMAADNLPRIEDIEVAVDNNPPFMRCRKCSWQSLRRAPHPLASLHYNPSGNRWFPITPRCNRRYPP